MKAIMKQNDVLDWLLNKNHKLNYNKIKELMYYIYRYTLVKINQNSLNLRYELFPARFYANHYFISKDNNAGRIDYPLIKKFHVYQLMNRVINKYKNYSNYRLKHMIQDSKPYQEAKTNHAYLNKRSIFNSYFNRNNSSIILREVPRNYVLKYSKVVNIRKPIDIKDNKYYALTGKQLQKYLKAIRLTRKIAK